MQIFIDYNGTHKFINVYFEACRIRNHVKTWLYWGENNIKVLYKWKLIRKLSS